MLLNALVAGAISACTTLSAPVHNADALFTQADTAIASRDIASARNAYETGMQQLSSAPWFIEDKGCEPPRYTLERFVATLHSLNVAIGSGEMPPLDASDHEQDVFEQLFKELPSGAYMYFYRTYPSLLDRGAAYINAIKSVARPAVIAAHAGGVNCARPNMDADVLDQARPDYPQEEANIGVGEVQVTIAVNLDAGGKITSATITKPSGSMPLDQAALTSARKSTYLPAVKNCTPVAGSYIYRVTFDPSF